MVTIHRYIFRLDFKPCYDVLDRPGQALSILAPPSKEGYWSALGLNRDRTGVSASKNDDSNGENLNITMESNSLSGSYASKEGFHLEDLIEQDFLNSASKFSEELLSKFQIVKIERIGFRILAVGGTQVRFGDNVERATSNMYNTELIAEISKIGVLTDLGVIVEGKLPSETLFRFSTGPGGALDRERLFELKPEKDQAPHAFTLDLDLSEKEIDFSKTTLYRWVKARIPNITNFAETSRKHLEN